MIQPPVRDEELGTLPVLRVWFGDEELWADCGNCGARIGQPLRPDGSLDSYSGPWERHSMLECPAK